eukprot:1527716-Rhodomonas_salina.2
MLEFATGTQVMACENWNHQSWPSREEEKDVCLVHTGSSRTSCECPPVNVPTLPSIREARKFGIKCQPSHETQKSVRHTFQTLSLHGKRGNVQQPNFDASPFHDSARDELKSEVCSIRHKVSWGHRTAQLQRFPCHNGD